MTDAPNNIPARHATLAAEDHATEDLNPCERKFLRDRFGMLHRLGFFPRPLLDKVFAILGLGLVNETNPWRRAP